MSIGKKKKGEWRWIGGRERGKICLWHWPGEGRKEREREAAKGFEQADMVPNRALAVPEAVT